MDRNREVNKALSYIEELNLAHPSGALLSSFIHNALHPLAAARYVTSRLSAGDASSLVSDWLYVVESATTLARPLPPLDPAVQRDIKRRDGNRCCITGKAGTLWDPLVVLPILAIPAGWVDEKPRVFDMLGAFFGPPYRDWWLSYASNPEQVPQYRSHWLVRKSAARAFAGGFVQLIRRQPSMIEYQVVPVEIGPEEPLAIEGDFPLLGDRSRSGIATVDARFVGTQARLAASIQYLEIARDLAPQLLSTHVSEGLATGPEPRRASKTPWFPPVSNCLSTLIRVQVQGLLAVWRALPRGIRLAAYDALRRLGARVYGANNPTAHVQRLPFGLYLKRSGNADMVRNEFNALQRVHDETSIPVPLPIDMMLDGDNSYLVMTRVPGVPIWRCQDVLPDADWEEIVTQLKDYLTQLRALPKTVNPAMPFCNTLGEAYRDHRISSADPVGPFPDEAAFSQWVRFSDEPSRRGHKSVFTHADLNPRNILVGRAAAQAGERSTSGGWRVTGIVDWETAGYYPEYWDYTKALFEGFRWNRRYLDAVHRVFAEFGDYSRELDVERRSWGMGDGV